MFRHADVVCLCLVCILWQFSMLRPTDQPCGNRGVLNVSVCVWVAVVWVV